MKIYWLLGLRLKRYTSRWCYSELTQFLSLDATSSVAELKISEEGTSGAPLKIFQPVPVVKV